VSAQTQGGIGCVSTRIIKSIRINLPATPRLRANMATVLPPTPHLAFEVERGK